MMRLFKRLTHALGLYRRQIVLSGVLFVLVVGLLVYKLPTLLAGMSQQEFRAAFVPVGWHGIYDQALNLPLLVVRSIVFWLDTDHGALTSRLPNALFGGLAVLSFGLLIRLWLGARIAIMATLLFACSAWTLHVSRYISFDVLYLWAIPTLLLSNAYLHRLAARKPWVLPIILAVWGVLLYVPGLIWFLALNIFLQRKVISASWKQQKTVLRRLSTAFAGIIWLPLLGITLSRPHNVMAWLGLPRTFAEPMTILKNIVAVPVHAFIRGPEIPTLWLGRAPVLDVFCLVMALLGIYFYVQHFGAARTKLLIGFGFIAILLVGIGGPVGFSAVVPLLFILVATGIAYLLREWLQTFPVNPIARGVGFSLIGLLVIFSCGYNLRAYFIAWPYSATTQSLFRYLP